MKVGIAGYFVRFPSQLGYLLTRREAARWTRRRAKLTPLQRKLHALIVQNLVRSPEPMTAEVLAQLSDESEADVQAAIDNLHTWLGFIALNEAGAVEWAYPVTVTSTHHELTLDSGERMTPACAADAVAVLYVLGRLQGCSMSATLRTRCAQSGRPMQMRVDSDLNIESLTPGADPVVSLPLVNFRKLRLTVIYDAL
jgi:hypothetical protein